MRVREVFQEGTLIKQGGRWLIVQMLRCVHAFMEHPNDNNLRGTKAVIDYVAVEMETAVACTHFLTGLAKFAVFSQLVKS